MWEFTHQTIAGAETEMSKRAMQEGALTVILASVQSLVWEPLMSGASWVEAPLGSSPVSLGQIFVLLLVLWGDTGKGTLWIRNGKEGKQRLVLSVRPLRSGAAESASQPPLSLSLSQLFFSLSLPFFLPLLSPSI